MDLLIHLDTRHPISDDEELKQKLGEALDKYFGEEEFAVDYYPHRPSGEARHALAAAHGDVPGRFQLLERFLYMLPLQAQVEFLQLINNYSQALADAKRKIREPWRR
jgi:hypothetical protein